MFIAIHAFLMPLQSERLQGAKKPICIQESVGINILKSRLAPKLQVECQQS